MALSIRGFVCRFTLVLTAFFLAPAAAGQGSPTGPVCEAGETLEQSAVSQRNAAQPGGLVYGQSFTATCSGTLDVVSPRLAAASPGDTWEGTLRVFEGEGPAGTELVALNVSGTTPATSGYYDLPVTGGVEVIAGQTYSFFVEVTSADPGGVHFTFSPDDPYAGGGLYRATNGSASSAEPLDGWDMAFRLTFGRVLNVQASDGSFDGELYTGAEPHVLVEWERTGEAGVFYQIERRLAGTTDAMEVLAVQAASESSFEDASARPGVEYEYCVEAIGSASTPYPSCDVGRRVLRQPRVLSASDSTQIDGVLLEWVDRSAVEVGYVIYRSLAEGTPTPYDTTAGDATFYFDEGAIVLQEYRYCVGLLYLFGGTETAAAPIACKEGTRGAVAPPTGVKASDGALNDRVRVVWSGPNAGTYAVYRQALDSANEPTGERLALTGAVTGLTYDDLAAQLNTPYRYCVTALDEGDPDDPDDDTESVEVCDTGRMGQLAPPTGVTATEGVYDNRVEVTWEDPGPDETGFRIYREPAGGARELYATLGADRTRYVDNAAAPGVVYTYCVGAIAEVVVDGVPVVTESDSRSDDQCAQGLRSRLLAPVNFEASDGVEAHEGYVELTWESTSSIVQLFRIRRDGDVLATLSPTVSKYPDRSALAGVEYTYGIEAVAVVGADAAVVSQGLAPILARAEAERVVVADLYTEAETPADVARAESLAREVEAELVDDVSDVLVGLGLDASALTSSAVAGDLVFASGGEDVGWRVLKAPGALSATTDREGGVYLTWDDRSDVNDWYEIAIRDVDADQTRTVWLGGNDVDYYDTEAVPSSVTEYTVRAVDVREALADGTDGPALSASEGASADGLRRLAPPTDVQVTQGTFEDQVIVSWQSESEARPSYVVRWEVGGVVRYDTLGADARRHPISLADTEVGQTVTASVRAVDEDLSVNNNIDVDEDGAGDDYVSATGWATLVTPRVFTASTGYTDKVVLTWTDDSNLNSGYRITGPGGYKTEESGGATMHTRMGTDIGGVYTIVPFSATTYDNVPAEARATGALLTSEARETPSSEPRFGDAGGLSLDPGAYFGWSVAADVTGAVAGAPEDIQDGRSVPDWARPYDPAFYKVYRGLDPDGAVARDSVGAVAFYAFGTDGDPEAILADFSGPNDDLSYNTEIGRSVDLHGDWALIGAPGGVTLVSHPEPYDVDNTGYKEFHQHEIDYNDGAAYLFRRNLSGDWVRQGVLRAVEGGHIDVADLECVGSGCPINLKTNGTSDLADLVFARANNPTELRQRTFQERSGSISEQTSRAQTRTPDIVYEQFGASVALSDDWAFVLGTVTEANGVAQDIDWVFAYSRSGSEWVSGDDTFVATASGGENLGKVMAASADVLAVSHTGNPSGPVVRTFWLGDAEVSDGPVIEAPPGWSLEFGSALDVDGDLLVVGDLGANRAHIYRRQGDEWDLEATVEAPYPFFTGSFGSAVAISDGFVSVTRASLSEPEVHSYAYQDGEWAYAGTVTAPNVEGATTATFGHRIATTGDRLVSGAPLAGPNEPGNNPGAVFFGTLSIPPGDVRASDGQYANRVQVRWTDLSDSETGFQIFRRGPSETEHAPLADVGPNVETYDDMGADPGTAYSYCVASVAGESDVSARACDVGIRPANGAISGRIEAGGGGFAAGVPVCLSPNGGSDPSYAPTQAVMFDGEAGQAVVDDFGAMPGAFTLEAWVNADGFDSPDSITTVAGVESSAGAALLRFRNVSGAYVPEFTVKSQGSAEAVRLTWSDPLEPGWHHLVGVYAEGAIALYADGAKIAEGHSQGFIVAQGAFRIGQSVNERFFDGRIDEVRLWDRALTADEIAAGKDRRLGGDEDGLHAYWPMQQGRGRILADYGPNGHHASLVGGAEWTPEASPAGSCATTDADGNYTIDGIRYGSSASFTVAPADQTRTFSPATKTVTLTTESPTENQLGFNDTSSFTVSGRVVHAVDQAQWPGQAPLAAPDVTVYVGDKDQSNPEETAVASGTTAADGSFSIAVNGTGNYDIWARAEVLETTGDAGADASTETRVLPLDFSAAYNGEALDDGALTVTGGVANVDLEGDLAGLTFTNTAQFALRGQAAGGCGRDIGSVAFRIYTEDKRFDQVFTTDGSQPYDLPLPPLPYRLQYQAITDVPDALDRADVVDYFRNLATLRADLSDAEADTVDFRYRAPITLVVEGLDAPSASCSAGYTVTREIDEQTVELQTIPNVPIIGEYDRVPLTIRAYEDYGDGNICNVDAATVRIFDGFADVQEDSTVTLVDGVAQYRTFGRSPDTFSGRIVDGVDRSYQKSLTAVLEVEDGPSVTETIWAVVEGSRERPATFTSATMRTSPLQVLRDPPGSQSYAYLEEGHTTCRTWSNINTSSAAVGPKIDFAIGFKAAANGPISIENGAGLLIQVDALLGGGVEQTTDGDGSRSPLNGPGSPENRDNIRICATTTERLRTPDGWISEDIFAGVALNVLFAEADNVAASGCEIELSDGLAMDLDETDPFQTSYVYGRSHITESVIPTLERLLRLQGDHTVEGDIGDNPIAIELAEAADMWRGILADAKADAAEALSAEVENRSFSAGAEYEYSMGSERETNDSRTEIVSFVLNGAVGAIMTNMGYDQVAAAQAQVVTESRITTAEDTTDTTVAGYVLYDDDGGDYFSVNVGKDPKHGTFVFETVGGASSNPWEEGTQRRDAPRLATTTPVIDGVLEGETAVLTLSLTNASESNERREYVVDVPPHLNPDGAAVTVNGYELREKRYLVEPNQTISIPVTVARGPEADSTRIGFVTYAEFEHDYWRTAPQFEMGDGTADTAFVEVAFTPLVRPVRLVEPLDGWAITASEPTLTLTLGDIDLDATTEEALAAEEVGAQYRRPLGAWTELNTLVVTGDELIVDGDPSTLRPSVSADWDAAGLPDGPYELRAYARRTGQSVAPWYYGPAVPGWIDRTAPTPFGLPQPADQTLALGETIGITFEEPIDCAAFRQGIADGTARAELAGVVSAVGCAERTVLLAPTDASAWDALEGQLVTARIQGVTDIAGNPMAPLADAEAGWDASWQFTVRRNAFGWTPSIVDVVAQPNTPTDLPAALVNGRAQPVRFELVQDVSDGSPPFVFEPIDENGAPTGGETVAVTTSMLEGTVVSGNVQPLAFRWTGAPEGTYRSTIEVESWDAATDEPLGTSPLVLTVEVACAAPAWAVNAAAFETNMTITAQVVMDGAASTDPADRLGAFVDGELRGVATVGENGTFSLTVHGTGAPERVAFQAWDQSACALHRTTSQVVEFASDVVLGSPSTPFVIDAPGAGGEPLTVPLDAGWNWVSTNREGTSDLASALVGVGRGEEDVIQSRSAFAQYVPGEGWQGELQRMTPGQGYHLKVALATEMVHPGVPVDPTAEIPLAAGWNWIGYLPNVALPIDDALAGGTFTTGDQIKSKEAYADYAEVDGVGRWLGSLKTLEPGLGYSLFVQNEGVLTYPAETAARTAPAQIAASTLEARPVRRMDTLPVSAVEGRPERPAAISEVVSEDLAEAAPTGDRPEAAEPFTATAPRSLVRRVEAARRFEHSMAITTTVDAASAGMHLAAYAVTDDGEELRGVARVDTVEALGGTRAFLLVAGAEGETFVLRAATATDDGVLVPIDEGVTVAADAFGRDATFTFAVDAVVGSADDPVASSLGSEGGSDGTLPEAVALAPTRPNPFSDRATFEFALPEPTRVRLVLYDVLGREVAVLADGEHDAGVYAVPFDGRSLASGSYVARLVAGPEVRVRTFTVAR